jgi:hypothetical protein
MTGQDRAGAVAWGSNAGLDPAFGDGQRGTGEHERRERGGAEDPGLGLEVPAGEPRRAPGPVGVDEVVDAEEAAGREQCQAGSGAATT